MSSLKDKILNMTPLQVSQLRTSSGVTLEEILRNEAQRLKDCIQKFIDEYYGSYSPSVYSRTFRFQRSLSVDDVVEVDVTQNQMRIYLLFDNNLAYHPSAFRNGQNGYVPVLINYGWQWKNDKIHKEHLSYYNGFNFVEKGIALYEQSNPYHIKMSVINNI